MLWYFRYRFTSAWSNLLTLLTLTLRAFSWGKNQHPLKIQLRASMLCPCFSLVSVTDIAGSWGLPLEPAGVTLGLLVFLLRPSARPSAPYSFCLHEAAWRVLQSLSVGCSWHWPICCCCGVPMGRDCFTVPCGERLDKTVSQSLCTALTAGICLPLGLCKGTVSSLWKIGGNCQWSCECSIHCNWGYPNLYSEESITKGWRQPIGSHVSCTTDSPTATRLGLCNSLGLVTLPGCGWGWSSFSVTSPRGDNIWHGRCWYT